MSPAFTTINTSYTPRSQPINSQVFDQFISFIAHINYNNMSTRVKLRIKNNTGKTVRCSHISCQQFDDLKAGVTIRNGQERTFHSGTNDRVFVIWEWVDGPAAWEMGMTCPRSSRNSAYGSYRAGLETYNRTGTPVTFTYDLGNHNRADWGNGDGYIPTAGLRYGECS